MFDFFYVIFAVMILMFFFVFFLQSRVRFLNGEKTTIPLA